MGADPAPGPTSLVVYLDRSDVDVSRFDELAAGVGRLVEFVESREPQLVSYGFYLDRDAAKMTVVAVHPNSASLELHMEIGMPEFRKLAHLLTLRQIEVYGSVSDRARAMLAKKAEALGEGAVVVYEPSAGFAHLPPGPR